MPSFRSTRTWTNNREWLKIPGPVLGYEQDFDPFKACPEFIRQKGEERAKRLQDVQAKPSGSRTR